MRRFLSFALLFHAMALAVAPSRAQQAIVTPNPVALDQSFAIQGAGYYPNSPVFLWWDVNRGMKPSGAGNVFLLAAITTDFYGNFSAKITYPAYQLYPVDAGDHQLFVGYYGLSGGVEGSAITVRLTPRTGWKPSPTLPDQPAKGLSGGILSYLRYSADQSATAIVLTDGAAERIVSETPLPRGAVGTSSWSPSGNALAISASLDTDPYTNLFVINKGGAAAQITAYGGGQPRVTSFATGSVVGSLLALVPEKPKNNPAEVTCTDDLLNDPHFPKGIRVNLVGTPFATIAPRPQGVPDDQEVAYPYEFDGVPEGDYWVHASYLTTICQDTVAVLPQPYSADQEGVVQSMTQVVWKPGAATPNYYAPIHVTAGIANELPAGQLVSTWQIASYPSWLDDQTVYYNLATGVFEGSDAVSSDIWSTHGVAAPVQLTDTKKVKKVGYAQVSPVSHVVVANSESEMGLSLADAANPGDTGTPLTNMLAMFDETGVGFADDNASWAPDGYHIAFNRRDILKLPASSASLTDMLLAMQTGVLGDLWVKNVATGQEWRYTQYNVQGGEGVAGKSAWSPDRKQIAVTYTQDNFKTTNVRVFNVADGSHFDLTNDGRSALPSWGSGTNLTDYPQNLNFKPENFSGYVVNQATPGDVNGDGKVNVSDATLVLRFAVGLAKATDAQKKAADFNGDGKVNVQDATLILRKAVGL